MASAFPRFTLSLRAVSILTAWLAAGLFSNLGAADADLARRKTEIEKREKAAPSVEALERRTQSIAFLQRNKIPTLATLPVIADSGEAKIRGTEEIAARLLACTICAVGGETGDRPLVEQLLQQFSAASLLSPKERVFVARELGDRAQRVQFSWRYERAWMLLWALGYVERLDFPTAICDVPKLVGFLRDTPLPQIIAGAKPRSPREILDAADLIYRLNWAVVNERVTKKVSLPPNLEKGVVQERHAALNWLIGYMGQAWDEVTTDT